MKILGLRFKNLNSLRGEWSVDFSSPEYCGVFAITGPTGSGKTTLLDAICMAMYGKTPRGESGGGARAVDEIMSKGAGECFSEVSFENGGVVYCCRFDLKRAYGKAGGRLQDPVFKVYRVEGDSQVACADPFRDRSKYERKMEEIVGMDFSQFTRAAMLAQGAFERFLTAGRKDKTEILEKMTGTDFYRRISVKVYERFCALRDDCAGLLQKRDSLSLLSPEDEAGLVRRAADLEGEIRLLEERAALLSDLRDAAALRSSRALELESALLSLAAAEKAFGEAESARRSARSDYEGFMSMYGPLSSVVGEIAERERDLAAARASLDVERKSLAETLAGLERIRAAVAKNAAEMELIEAEGRAVRSALEASSADRSLVDSFAAVESGFAELERLRSSIKRIEMKIADSSKRSGEIESSLMEAVRERSALEASLRELSEKIGLISGGESSESILAKRDEVHERAKRLGELEDLIGRRGRGESALERAESEIGRLRSDRDSESKRLDALVAEEASLRSVKDGLDRAVAAVGRVLSLSSERERLEDGKPCPLCGALEHPYALGNAPALGALDRELEIASAALSKKSAEVGECSKRLAGLEGSIASSEKWIAGAGEELRELRAVISERLMSEGLELSDSSSIGDRAKRAAAEYERLGALYRELAGLEKKTRSVEALLSNAAGRIASLESDGRNCSVTLSSLEEELALAKRQRDDSGASLSLLLAPYGTYDLESPSAALRELGDRRAERVRLEEEARRIGEESRVLAADSARLRESEAGLSEKLSACEDSVAAAGAAVDSLLASISALDARSSEYPGSAAEKRSALEGRRSELMSALSSAEASFAASKEKVSSLRGRRLSLEEDLSGLDGRISGLSSKAGVAAEDCSGVIAALGAERDSKISARSECLYKIDVNEKAKMEEKGIEAELESMRARLGPWERLNALIGSADGAKYQTFAQRITLSILVRRANFYLRQLSSRYDLCLAPASGERDPKVNPDEFKGDDMSLFACDHDMGDVVRPVSYLSGGEKFMASLALALALAGIAGGRLRVDSLFIDEGFATLDSDSLSGALAVLGRLAGEGRTIGVISHVEAMKEAIRTKIEVRKVSEGRSVISGPGVTSVKRGPEGPGRAGRRRSG